MDQDDIRVTLTAAAILCYCGLAALTARSGRHAGRVAHQWGPGPGRMWQRGKWYLFTGMVLAFAALQNFAPIPQPWRGLLYFGALGISLVGEWIVGTAFATVATAQDLWDVHRTESSRTESWDQDRGGPTKETD